MRAAVVLGFTEGLLIALLGVGVVLVYKAERFVNFANAQLGVLSSLVLAKLVLDAGVSWYVAFIAAVLLGVGVGALCRLGPISRLESLAQRSRMSLMIASLGISQLLLALAFFTWLGPDRRRLQEEGYPLPFEVFREFDGLAITGRHVLITVLAPAVMLGLVVWLQTSAFGRNMRAAASNPDAARLAGIDIRRTRTVTWALAGGISAIGAVLASPGGAALELQLTGPLLLLLSLGAGALGGFTSLPGVVVAGIGLGIVQGVGVHIGRSTGAGMAAVFGTVLVGLLVRSMLVGRAEADDMQIEASEEPLRIPDAISDRWFVRRRTLVLTGVSIAIAIVLPFLPWLGAAHRTYVLAHAAAMALAALSLTLLSGWAGQVSLGQYAFVGIGAFTAARVAPQGWSLLATMLVAGLVGAAFAVATGLPAARSRGLALAVTSLGVAVVGPVWLFRQTWFAPGASTVEPAYQAGLGRLVTQRSLYFVAIAVLTVAGLALARLRRTNAGRAVIAVRDNVPAAATLGFSPALVRLMTFAASGALAAVAGVLWLAVNRNISVQVFSPNTSLLLLSAVVIAGPSSVAGAVLGAAFVFAIPALLADPLHGILAGTTQLQLFFSGAGLIGVQIQNPAGIASVLRRGFQRRLDRAAADVAPPRSKEVPRRAPARLKTGERPDAGSVALSLRQVRVDFDAVTAVDDVTLDVAAGEIVGVIGANGAGKTTLLNAICGLVPASGSVAVYGTQVGGLAPHRRARLGVSRGFQDARLFPALTVRETIELALERQHPTGRLGALVGTPWVRLAERTLAVEADGVIDRFGLAAYADMPGDRLSTGTRHVCDLAAQAATRPRLMILDEPTSGIAQRETEAFRPLIRDLAEELGCAMLVVEHDMPFLMAVADRIYCLDRGRVIAEGTPAVVRKDPAVVASYLGVEGVRRVRKRRAVRRAAPARAARVKP